MQASKFENPGSFGTHHIFNYHYSSLLDFSKVITDKLLFTDYAHHASAPLRNKNPHNGTIAEPEGMRLLV